MSEPDARAEVPSRQVRTGGPVITYAIIIERADHGGFGAWCPDLSGCLAR